MNRITLVGNLTKAPELRTTSSGKAVCHMTIASDRGRKSDASDFVDVIAWEALASEASTLAKGAFVRVQGTLRTRTYQAADGSTRKAFEVVARKFERVPSAKQEVAARDASWIIART